MDAPYHVYRTATGFGVYFQDDEDPFCVLHTKEVAQDFATVLNWAAADRERHAELPKRTPQS